MDKLQAISAPFTKGVNFTFWLEFRKADQVDEGMFTRKDFENVRRLGCDVVRLPIHFENFCSPEDGYRIHEKILGILDNCVRWATELGMYLILDFHNNTGSESFTSEAVEDILAPVWTQLAERYRDASEYVIYELMNEPHGIEIPVWNAIIERIHQLVRTIDRKHYIVVGGADWNSFRAMKELQHFRDDKVIYTFHFYDPHTFTHQGATWCNMERIRNIPFPYVKERMPALPENPTKLEIDRFERYPKEGTVEAVAEFFDQYAAFSRERNAPIYCGEFGCFSACADPEERAGWYRIVTTLLSERGISRTSWDYYGAFGIFRMKPQMFREHRLPQFPEDLNLPIVEAMGLNTEFNDQDASTTDILHE